MKGTAAIRMWRGLSSLQSRESSRLSSGRDIPRSDSGFTLLEVMVASLILALTISALLVNLHNSLRNVERLSSYDRASVFAQHKMDELLADPTLGVLARVSGPYLPGADPSQSRLERSSAPLRVPSQRLQRRLLARGNTSRGLVEPRRRNEKICSERLSRRHLDFRRHEEHAVPDRGARCFAMRTKGGLGTLSQGGRQKFCRL